MSRLRECELGNRGARVEPRMDARERDGDTDRAYPTDRTYPMFPRFRRRALRDWWTDPTSEFSSPKQDRIIDDAYNKYARDDDEDLPEWFLEDERKFMRPPPVYSEKDLAEANERLAAVDTRSIKKVAEAKWRKKKRAEAKMAQARKRASTIMEQDDVPDVSKAREIEKIYAKAKAQARGKRKETKHVVARKFHKGNAGGPSVDKRMLADRRGMLKAKGGTKKGGRGGRGGRSGRGGANKGGGGGRGRKGFK